MEIIHVLLGKANPNRMNGVNKVVNQLATQQAKTWRYTEVWGISSDQTHNYESRNFETRLFLKEKNPFKISNELKQAILKTSTVSVFHLHGGWVPCFYALCKYLKKHNKRVVITPHGAYNTIAMRKNKWVKNIYFQLFEKPLLKRVDAIHCLGHSEKEGLNAIYKNKKQQLVPYGFEMPKMQPVKPPASETDFVVGFVGRIDMYTKGLDLLVEAFARLDPRSKLWIVGEGSDLKKLKELASSFDIAERVTFFGSQFGQEKNSLIQQMDVFVHSSRNEGLPTAVLEACSFSVPCVVTQATNVAHLVEEYQAGVAVDNDSTQSLHEGLSLLQKKAFSGTLNPLGRNAKKLVSKEFEWTYVVEQFDTIYLEQSA